MPQVEYAPLVHQGGSPRIENLWQLVGDALHIRAMLGAKRAKLPVPMAKTTADGVPLFTNGHLGCDLIHLGPGESFEEHVHLGDHLLYFVRGRGSITLGTSRVDTNAGDIYMVPGETPHAVGAARDNDHFILAIGAPHSPIDSAERMRYICPSCQQPHDAYRPICDHCLQGLAT